MGLSAQVIDQDIDLAVAQASEQASHEQGLGAYDVCGIDRGDVDKQVDVPTTRGVVDPRAEQSHTYVGAEAFLGCLLQDMALGLGQSHGTKSAGEGLRAVLRERLITLRPNEIRGF
jgi:hypothetical protein